MSILALILALVLDRLFPVLRAYRTTHSFSDLWLRLEGLWLSRKLPGALLPCILLLPVLLFIWLLYQIFTASLLVFGLNLIVAFYCLRPSVVNEDVDDWLSDIEAGKVHSRGDAQRLFVLANKSLYTLIFWFILLGPLAAVTYRLLDLLTTETQLSSRKHWLASINQITGWIEWLPAILSSFIFMITGNFDAGLRAARSIAYINADVQALNEERLQQIGIATVAGNDQNLDDSEILRRSRGLLLRALVLWLVCASLFEYWL